MHVEAIVWAALAMRSGGGYLDPEHWHCWRNSQWKRVLRRLGASGRTVLRSEHFEAMNRFIEQHRIRPVIDRVFNFDSVVEAYDYVDQGRHFGKVVIKL